MHPGIVVVSGVLATLLSAVLVKVSIYAGTRWRFLDHPDMERKTQAQAVPKLGGVAVAAAFTASFLTLALILDPESLWFLCIGILLPALGAGLLGFFDDKQHLNPYLRLFVQALLALISISIMMQEGVLPRGLLIQAVAAVWIVGIANGFNLIDNTDGLAGSTAVIVAIGLLTLALTVGIEVYVLAGVVLLGAALGFLRYNWPPARVYLGDSGAYFLGFLVAGLSLSVLGDQSFWLTLLTATLMLALPVVDLIFVVFFRVTHNIHPFTAGRDHLSHRLQGTGAGVRRTILSLQMISLAGVLGAVTVSFYWMK